MKYNSIIISHSPSSGGTTLGKELSKIYGWHFYSIGDLWRQKWKTLYPNSEVLFEDYWKGTSREENIQVNLDAKKIIEKGNVIFDGRYAIFFKDLPALFVFVTAPLEVRAKRAIDSGKYTSRSLEDVKLTLLQREIQEVRTGRKIVDENYDYRNSEHYHLVLNSGKFSVDEEIKIITNILPSPKKI